MLKELLGKIKSYKIGKEIGEEQRVEEIEDPVLNPYHLRVMRQTKTGKETIVDGDVENMKLIPFMNCRRYYHCYGNGILVNILGKQERRTFWKEEGKASREITQLKGMQKKDAKGNLATFINDERVILLEIGGLKITEIVDCEDAILFSESIVELMKDDFFQYVNWEEGKKETEYLVWPFKERNGYQINKTIDNHWKLYKVASNEITEIAGFIFEKMERLKHVPDDNLFIGYYEEKIYLVHVSETQVKTFDIPGDRIKYTEVMASRVLSFSKDEIFIEKEKPVKLYEIQGKDNKAWLGKFDQDGNFLIL